MALRWEEPVARRRFAVLCPGFALDRVRRQPWHVADGLARGLSALGHEASVVTDLGPAPSGLPYGVTVVPELFTGRGASRALRAAVNRLAVERAFLITGASRLARLGHLDLEAPVTLIMASPRLAWHELARLSVSDLWRERAVLLLPLLNALLPASLLRAGIARSGADGIVYLSPATRARFGALGLPPGRLLLPQIERQAIVPPMDTAAGFTIGYFGPPLASRGADLALTAFEQAAARGLDGRLLLLLRPDSGAASIERLLARVARSPWRQRIECRTEMLAAPALHRELARCHAFLLPFRVTISEVPLVVIESCLSGRPTIVLDAPGVGEIARRLGGIVASRPEGLADALLAAATRTPTAAPDPAAWTDWSRAVAPLLEPQVEPFGRYRMIALAGVDGSGKTFLLHRLAQRLDAAGIAHRHVWSRFRNYLSKPFLALTRLTGHNRKECVQGVRIGYHEFAGRPWLSLPFLMLQTADCVIDGWWRFGGRNPDRRLVLADRCLFDTLVDLAADTGLDELILGPLGRWLVRRLPAPRLVVVLSRPVAQIRRDRPDALLDRKFARRRALYQRLAREFELPILENDGTPEALLDRLEQLAASAPP